MSKEAKKSFQDQFEYMARRTSYAQVFTDFLEYTLLMLNMNKCAADFAELETRWPDPEDHKGFIKMFMAWQELSLPFEDALGDLFMEFVSHGNNGQFFTPMDICGMIGLMAMTDPKDGQKVMDCACGSARMLLSAGKRNRNMLFYGADNDLNCVKMAAINMIVNTMCGEIAHMDSLSLQHWKSYHIRKRKFGGMWVPYYFVTGPGETSFIERIEQARATPQAAAPVDPGGTDDKGQFFLF